MVLSRRRKLVVAALLLYWPAIFIGTHIPRVPSWAGRIAVSDKVVHFAAYLLLSFLLWFAINPDKKVNWRRPAAWWVLFAVVWYGVIDEWLQMYVGRSADVRDFLADLLGAATGLGILSLVNFWPASLVITGTGIFALTNLTRAHPLAEGPRVELLFCVCAYGFVTLLWLRYIHHFLPVRSPQGRWLAGAAALPIGLMGAIEVFCAVAGHGFSPLWALLATGATVTAVAPFFTYGLFKNRAAGSAPC